MTSFALSDADELRILFTAAGFKTVDIFPEPTIRQYRDTESVTFPMFAHIAVAIA
jgi:hypothetical protein